MIIDTSALIGILTKESDWVSLLQAVRDAAAPKLSAGNFLEASIVVGGRDAVAHADLDDLLVSAGVEIVPVSVEHAIVAREAYNRFGKGNHRAKLNFGDCFAYALARATGEPLLFKGDDFRKTDVEAAL